MHFFRFCFYTFTNYWQKKVVDNTGHAEETGAEADI
jgi:hypothetical protein